MRILGILAASVLAISARAHDARAQTAQPQPPEISAQEATQKAEEAYKAGDFARFKMFTQKAADQGVAEAQFNLGLMYESGREGQPDYGRAMTWYRKAAEQGLAAAQTNVGALYEAGRGVVRDYAQAMIWFRKAADQGYAPAQNNVGLLYGNGRGARQDYAQALIWFRRAADQGNPSAYFAIGAMYENGFGVEKDAAQAVYWYEQAAASGHPNAKAKLAALREPSNVKTESFDFVCRNARVTTLISVDPASRAVKVQGVPSMEFKEGKKYYVTVTNDLIEFGCRKTLTDVEVAIGIARNGAAQWFDIEKSGVAPIDFACIAENRIDRRTGIWTASRSTVAGPQSEVSECSLAAKRKLDAGQSRVAQAPVVKRSLACSADFMQLKPGASGARMDDFTATPLVTGTVVEIIGDELRGSIPIRVANGEVGSVNAKAFDAGACQH